MIKAEVVNKENNVVDVQVTVEGTESELYTEISSILQAFDKRPEMTVILIKAMDKLIQKAMEDK